ncbi:Thymidine kinase [Caldalkalibacillus thermarum TA2.A1]|uniref:Thymidine kinase n=1 Tax=Caldalkalibacillus thermarum (strain TA2.A1) TaxID=986075 RepID=F5L4X0_CALTT|nr:thymidine kinase [Caldalkalibacillus thermarum]EGL83622.1 Thymidine kinase [Caldalkalibacillus thermarum TA2.A1]
MGHIETIYGCMFAGKTTELIRRVEGKNVLAFKPKLDNRYSTSHIVSHNGETLKAVLIDTAEEILDHVNGKAEYIAIDEVHFFDIMIGSVCRKLANQGYRIICAGLDLDFRGEPFPPMPYLVAISHSVTHLRAKCVCCGKPATRTQRLIDGQPAHVDDPVIMVGADDLYEPRCVDCHEVRGVRKKMF